MFETTRRYGVAAAVGGAIMGLYNKVVKQQGSDWVDRSA
jgi:hypothetical protein